jgi:hypothetical protein
MATISRSRFGYEIAERERRINESGNALFVLQIAVPPQVLGGCSFTSIAKRTKGSCMVHDRNANQGPIILRL